MVVKKHHLLDIYRSYPVLGFRETKLVDGVDLFSGYLCGCDR